MKTHEQYLVLDFPDWWIYDTLDEARKKAAELTNPGYLDPVVIYKAFEEVGHIR